jgi:hypothetical protein
VMVRAGHRVFDGHFSAAGNVRRKTSGKTSRP